MMRFKKRRVSSQIPDVNLVPMMDVLMTVLTFFIIISMTLRGQQLADVNLPQTNGTETEATTTDPPEPETLIVGLSENKEILIDNRAITSEQLSQQVQAFLAQHPEGIVLLKADRTLTYRDVNRLLKTLRDIGGNRVSLAFDRHSN